MNMFRIFLLTYLSHHVTLFGYFFSCCFHFDRYCCSWSLKVASSSSFIFIFYLPPLRRSSGASRVIHKHTSRCSVNAAIAVSTTILRFCRLGEPYKRPGRAAQCGMLCVYMALGLAVAHTSVSSRPRTRLSSALL